MKYEDKQKEYDYLLNNIMHLTVYAEKYPDRAAKRIIEKGFGVSAEKIKSERSTTTNPELRELQDKVLRGYYNLMKVVIFEEDLPEYKCQGQYSENDKARIVKTANEKIKELPNKITLKGKSKEEVLKEAELIATKLELSKRYLGEVLKCGTGIIKVNNIHNILGTYVKLKKAITEWKIEKGIETTTYVISESIKSCLQILSAVGNTSSECKSGLYGEWELERIRANKYDLKRDLNSAIVNNDFNKVDKINDELKAYNSRHGLDRYEDTRFL